MIHLTKILAGVLVLLALALGGYAWWLGHKPAPVAPVAEVAKPQSVPLHAVVVTSKAVPAGVPLTADALRVAQLPINPAGALNDIDSAIGRMPSVALGEGTPVMQSQLISGLALRLNEGERAVAVKADEVMGVGNKVRPGDFVDVFFVLKMDSKEIEQGQARLLLPRLRVLAFGAASLDGVPPVGDGPSGKTAPPAQIDNARSAVLAVSVEDVPRLVLGESSGRLLLALRHPADLALPDAELFAALPSALSLRNAKPGAARPEALNPIDRAHGGLQLADLARGHAGSPLSNAMLPVATQAAPRPAVMRPPSSSTPRAAGGSEVEMIRGDKRETVSY